MERFEYVVRLTPATEGGFVVSRRDLAQLVTQGDDQVHALAEAGITEVRLAMRLCADEKDVRRLLDPHFVSKWPRIAQAIDAPGHRLVIGLESA